MSDIKYLTIPNLPASVIERFFSKVAINPISGCWLWTAGKARGYGKFWFKGKTISAHRFVYAWLIEPLPKGKGKNIPELDHIVCDTVACCNPWHVKLVLPRKNTLRGNGPSAKNARKTHCQNGHPLPPYTAGNRRACRICATITNQNLYLEQKAQECTYYHRNRDTVLLKMRAHRLKNKDKINAKARKQYHRDIEQSRAEQRERYRRKKNHDRRTQAIL